MSGSLWENWPSNVRAEQRRKLMEKKPKKIAKKKIAKKKKKKKKKKVVEGSQIQISYPEGAAAYEEVDHPSHYGTGTYEAIKVIEAWDLGRGFNLGSALKYIARAGRKPGVDAVTDLEKAAWYINREIDRIKEPE